MATRERNIIDLRFEADGGQVRIVTPDSHVMYMSIQAAVEVCRAFTQQVEFKDQFDNLIKKIGLWIQEHLDDVHSAYLTTRDAGLLFVIVQQSKQFNEPLVDALTQLDVEIASDADFSLIRLGVHALPRTGQPTIESFLSRDMTLRWDLHGD